MEAVDAAHLYELGVASLARGDAAAACRALGAAALERPDAAPVHTALGHARAAAGDWKGAASAYRDACELVPDEASAWSDLASALRGAGEHEDAERAARRALDLDPDHAAARNNLAVILLEDGDPARALEHFDHLLRAEPGSAVVLANRARTLHTLGRLDRAIADWRAVVALEGRQASASALANLARALHEAATTRAEMQLVPEVIALLERARDLAPGSPAIRTNLASALYAAGHLERARDEAYTVWNEHPGDALTCALLRQTLGRLADWDHIGSIEGALDRANEAALRRGACPAEPPLSHLARCDDPRQNVRIAAAWSAHAATRAHSARPAFTHENIRRTGSGRRVRIGYLSGDFREHPIAHLVAGVIRDHDRRRFEVRTYATSLPDASDVRARIARASDAHVELGALAFADAAERIHADQVDILIDISTHTESGRLEIPALRPAPVQVAYLGFPGSTGADFFDYAIVDPVIAPADDAHDYSETLLRLPYCYQAFDPDQPIAEAPRDRAALGLPAHGLVFACFAKASKLDRSLFSVWLDLLRHTRDAVLWLLDDHDARDALRTRARASGIEADRLVFAPRVSRPRHLARLRMADLVLDTRLYNGHTTTSDAVFCGVPVVTLEGRHFASRVSASILRAADLPETIAPQLDAYRAIALDLAHDTRAREALRARLRARRSPYFDRQGFLDALESAYLQAWQSRGGPETRSSGGSQTP